VLRSEKREAEILWELRDHPAGLVVDTNETELTISFAN